MAPSKHRGLIYLASPYSSPYGHERALRAKHARRAMVELAVAGEVVFSPIAYGHALDEAMPYGVRKLDHDYWMQLCLPILTVAQRLFVLTIPGWDTSSGVREEVRLAARMGKPVLGYNPFGLPEDDIHGLDIIALCALPPGHLDRDPE